jgi:hypothetical protein
MRCRRNVAVVVPRPKRLLALKVALRTMQRIPHPGSPLLHKALATASGATGGAFGLAALPIELPVSTIIMLRSIADIARSEGEDLSDPESALSCMQVFALGGRTGSDDASESGYFAVRGTVARDCAIGVAIRDRISRGRTLYRYLSNGRKKQLRSCGTEGFARIRAGHRTNSQIHGVGEEAPRIWSARPWHNCRQRSDRRPATCCFFDSGFTAL